jgi:hypothetical protein|tara:strand:- start:79 stop:402 length:324 start_codon:yes stop_codon:yes gene_type:complete
MIDKKDMKKESTHQANREGDHILEELAEINADAIVLEPQSTFNRAIVGSDTDSRLVYSVTKIISALVDEDGMDEQEALEWFEFNTLGTFSGMDNINKPIFIYDEFIF